MLTIPPGRAARIAIRNIESAFLELMQRVGLGVGRFRAPRIVLNKDGSVDGRLLITDLPKGADLIYFIRKLQEAMPPIQAADPGVVRIMLDWKLAVPATDKELEELQERYLPTRSGKMPFRVPSSYYGTERWQEAFRAARNILAALKERGRRVSGLSIEVYWDPRGRYRTVRKKAPKPGYVRTWAWRPPKRKR